MHRHDLQCNTSHDAQDALTHSRFVVSHQQSKGTRMRETGKILDTFPIYSDECLVVLRQALEVAQADQDGADAPNQRLSTFQSRYADSSSEDEHPDHKESSSSSLSGDAQSSEEEEDERTDTVGELPAFASPSPLATDDETLPPPADSTKPMTRKKKTKKITPTERQLEAQIRKHVENLVRFSLPVPEPERAVLDLAASLLSKDERLSENTATLRRSFLSLATELHEKPVVVLLLRSGRFAGGVFQGDKVVVHRTLQRYTVRKGQGKAQSAQDGNRRPKSMGSQLRRAGEESLRQDVGTTLLDWKVHVKKACLVLISCPKTMKKGLFDGLQDILTRDDCRIRRVPIDFGRPSFENVSLIHSVLMRGTLRESPSVPLGGSDVQPEAETALHSAEQAIEIKKEAEPVKTVIALTELHQAAKSGNVQAILDILDSGSENASTALDHLAGENFMTPLHYAAESAATVEPSIAADCVYQLLIKGRADATLVDGRNRVPYFLASNDKVRDAFRMARATLGEDYCEWDKGAKVGPPLTEEDLERRKEKELEKKRKKRARQKEKKATEKAQAEEMEEERHQQETVEQHKEEAKRVRDGLQPKQTTATNVCDFCQAVSKGRRRNQMFKRLDYAYCNSECVQKHKRELMAAAALSRFEK